MHHAGLSPLRKASTIATAKGEPKKTLELLEPTRGLDHAPEAQFWPAYLRGQANLREKSGRAARLEFQSTLDHRGEAVDSMLYPLASLGLARAADLEGDRSGALEAYDRFLGAWENADAGPVPLQEARLESSHLR